MFETNSSSTHSISICGQDDFCTTHLDKVKGKFGEFGWGYEILSTVNEKLSYVLTMIQYRDDALRDRRYDDDKISIDEFKESQYFQWLNEMIENETGKSLNVELGNGNCYPMGYIDHESTGLLNEYWSEDEAKFKDNMKDFIFNIKYQIIIDNDNN